MSNAALILAQAKNWLLRLSAFCALALCAASAGAANWPGLVGDYYPGLNFSGSPLSQVDATVNFDWGAGAPRPGIGADQFSVRWTGYLRAPSAGNYKFRTVSDDGVRLWVGNTQIINDWTDHAATTDTSASVSLTANQVVPITLEYYENGGSAVIQLQWDLPGSGSNYVIIPAAAADSSAGLFYVAPKVASMNLAGANPTNGAASVAWTVVFDSNVTGVDASDFALVPSGGASGAMISSVTGSGNTWTVSANVGSGVGNLGLNLIDDDSIIDANGSRLGGPGAGNGNFTGAVYSITKPFCSQPTGPGVPDGLTCVCDTFGRSQLNPSTIFGANWIASTSDDTGKVPGIVSGRLRLTDNTGNNAKAVTVPGIFPAAGNYISVEFQQFAYNGSGADGIAVTLSDYATPAVPGAFGGSLGYAQKTGTACGKAAGCPGFAGGWLGVALDEFGNYSNPTEGRIGGPGAAAQSVGVRGSGSGASGYNWIGGKTPVPSPDIDSPGSTTAAPGNYYQVIVDARNYTSSSRKATVLVNRDTGSGYNNLVSIPDVYSAATAQGFTQAAVPSNWQISFTGSTGGSTNIHEIGNVRICAQTVYPPGGGSASGFNAIDEAYGNPATAPVPVQNYQTGHIYTKLMGVPFNLNVAAFQPYPNDSQIQTSYITSDTKTVTVNLVDNSDGACVLDNTQANYCSAACTGKAAVAGGSQAMSFAATDKGQKQFGSFTLKSAYRNLAAIITDPNNNKSYCATDSFSVRPIGLASASTTASNAGSGGTPIFKASIDPFTLTATTVGVSGSPSLYMGVLKVDGKSIAAVLPASGAKMGNLTGTFGAAVSGTPSSTATGAAFTYSEVGVIQLPGYDPAINPTALRGIYDGVASATECASPVTPAQCDVLRTASWTGVDSISAKNDCVLDSYSNVKSGDGKYGCNFGLQTPLTIGRFIPSYLALSGTSLTNRSDLSCPASGFTYMNEPMLATFTLTAKNGANETTENYDGGLAKLNLAAPSSFTPGALGTASLTSRLGALSSSGSWARGVASNVSLGFQFLRAATPDGPFISKFGIAPQDSDGVTMLPSAYDLDIDTPPGANDHATIGQTSVRFGRLKLGNAFGSEKLDLPVPLEAQYWNGIAFVPATEDSCTPLAKVNAVLGNYMQGLNSSNLGNSHVQGLGVLASGKGQLVLSKPDLGATGGADLAIKLGSGTSADQSCPSPLATAAGAGLAYLQSQWCGTDFAHDPRARIRFGVYKNANQMIYLREMY